MNNYRHIGQIIFSAVGGWLSWFLGGFDSLLTVLVIFVCADYVTGVMCGIAQRSLSSEIGLKGILKKVIMFITVGLASLLEGYIFNGAALIRSAVIFFYISNEGLSVLENASRLGIKLPERLKDVLKQVNEENRD